VGPLFRERITLGRGIPERHASLRRSHRHLDYHKTLSKDRGKECGALEDRHIIEIYI